MEQLKKIVEGLKKQSQAEEEIIHTVREYLQVLLLKLIFQSNQGAALSFMGGAALRLCYELKRFSEDLNFTRDDTSLAYDFNDLVGMIEKELSLLGFQVTTNAHADKRVQKAMLRFVGLGGAFAWKSFRKEQKLNVKLEVDLYPVPLKSEGRESFFITRFEEIFPILKHDLPTLFAGKVLAILQRPFDRGRDYYDLIWYLSKKVPLNLEYLNRGLKQGGFKDLGAVFAGVQAKVDSVPAKTILKDIQALLEDPTEVQWILEYPKVFKQLLTAYLGAV